MLPLHFYLCQLFYTCCFTLLSTNCFCKWCSALRVLLGEHSRGGASQSRSAHHSVRDFGAGSLLVILIGVFCTARRRPVRSSIRASARASLGRSAGAEQPDHRLAAIAATAAVATAAALSGRADFGRRSTIRGGSAAATCVGHSRTHPPLLRGGRDRRAGCGQHAGRVPRLEGPSPSHPIHSNHSASFQQMKYCI